MHLFHTFPYNWIRVVCPRSNILILKAFVILKQSSCFTWIEWVLNTFLFKDHCSQIIRLIIDHSSILSRTGVLHMTRLLIRKLWIMSKEYVRLLCFLNQSSTWLWRSVVCPLFWFGCWWRVWWDIICSSCCFWYRILILIWIITWTWCCCHISRRLESWLQICKRWMPS